MDVFHTTPPADLGVFALGLVIAGVVGGLAAGVLGIGGGIVVVPVLYHVMAALGVDAGIRMHIAAGTSLGATVPALLSRARRARAAIDWTRLQRWSAPMLAGVVCGVALATAASGRMLATIFAVVALPVAFDLAWNSANRPSTMRMPDIVGRWVLSALIGGASTMTGMGADASGAPALKLFGVPPRQAAATASVFGVMAAVPGAFGAILLGWNVPTLPPGSLGYVNLIGFALVAPVLLPAEAAGTALAHLVDMRRLHLVFAALVAIATARMLWDAWA